MKRLFDVTVSAIGIVLALPVFVIITIAVRMDSRGSVLFRQERVGRFGRPFEILKFRTMTPACPGSVNIQVAARSDPRITHVGKVLRSTKLDELPQLFNVLNGSMSFVGPRPEVQRYAACWTPEQRAIILSVRPGITDPASVLFRREAEILARQRDPEAYYVTTVLPRKAELYVEYVRTRSFASDMHVLIATLRSVVAT